MKILQPARASVVTGTGGGITAGQSRCESVGTHQLLVYPGPMSEQAVHHEGSTCAFCSKADVCGHPQVHGAAILLAAPWVPNVWVKSIPTDNTR